jgi:KDO2-lipid IV(A) lauroyltransferase
MVGRWVARLLVNLMSRLPLRSVGRLARMIGGLAYFLGIRRDVALDNLAHAFPEKSEEERRRIARGAYTNMARAFLEGLACSRMTSEQVAERVVLEGGHRFDEAWAQGRGVLIATAHFGSWELMGEVMARRGLPVHCVVKPLKGALNAELVASRTKNGLRLIPGRGALRGTIAALRDNQWVTMLIDQVLPAAQGVFVPFFGRLACTNPSLSWAARRSGAPVLGVMGVHEGDRLRLYVEGPFPLPEGDRDEAIAAHTATLTAVIERYIRRYPDQWLWLHRRWKVKPEDAVAEPPMPLKTVDVE